MKNSLLIGSMAIVLTLLGSGQVAGQQTAITGPESARAMVDRYCVGCHNVNADVPNFGAVGQRTQVLLDTADISRIGEDPALWERVVRKLRAGMMPPVDIPRPDRATLDGFIAWLETELDEAALRGGYEIVPPGLHRLNRAEYTNAVKDLLDLPIDAAAFLPVDDSSSGFDNVAASLGLSTALLEAYVTAATKISRLAVGHETGWKRTIYRTVSDFSQEYHVPGLPFGTRGGMVVEHFFPVDGQYDINFQPVRSGNGYLFGDMPNQQLEILIDGERVRLWDFDTEIVTQTDADLNGVRVFVKAGLHKIGATFLADHYAPLTLDLNDHFMRTQLDTGKVAGFNYYQHLSAIGVDGPYNVQMLGAETASRRKIFTCRPTSEAEELPCAEQIASELSSTAFRRPTNAEDLETLLEFYQQGRSTGTFEDGIELVVLRILADPEFIFPLRR